MTTANDVPALVQSPYEMHPEPVPVSTRTGRIAMIMGLAVLGGSLAVSVLMGIAVAPYAVAGPMGFSVYLRLDSADPREVVLAVCALAHGLIGTVFGTWALVQGIVAIAMRRGSGFGIVAIVAAFLAPGLSLMLYMGIALAGVGG